MLRVFLLFTILLLSEPVSASCNRFQRFVMGTVQSIISTSYGVANGDGCPNEEGHYSLGDLFHENVILRDDYSSIVDQTFQRLENDDSWNLDGVLLRNIKRVAPGTYERMKNFFMENTGSLLGLNSAEKELVRENPAGALWVMYNGKKAKDLQRRYESELEAEVTDPRDFGSATRREDAGYLGTADAFRHIAWNTMSARFGFDDFAKRFIDAHEQKDQPQGSQPMPGPVQAVSGVEDSANQSLSMVLAMSQDMDDSQYQENNNAVDTQMDHHNNNLGRELAQDLYCTVNEDNIFNRIKQSINNGDARIVDNCRGRPWVLKKSNEDFAECNFMLNPDQIEARCEEAVVSVPVTLSMDELINRVKEGSSPQVLTCAYYKNFENHVKTNFNSDSRIQDLFTKRDAHREEMARDEEDTTDPWGMPVAYSLEEEDERYFCEKIYSLSLDTVSNQTQCSDALMQMGFSINFNPSLEGFSGVTGGTTKSPGAGAVMSSGGSQ